MFQATNTLNLATKTSLFYAKQANKKYFNCCTFKGNIKISLC